MYCKPFSFFFLGIENIIISSSKTRLRSTAIGKHVGLNANTHSQCCVTHAILIIDYPNSSVAIR